jgi:hypothetical protein
MVAQGSPPYVALEKEAEARILKSRRYCDFM